MNDLLEARPATQPELALYERLDAALELCRIERRGIYARDIDRLLKAERELRRGRLRPSRKRLARLMDTLDRVEIAPPRFPTCLP